MLEKFITNCRLKIPPYYPKGEVIKKVDVYGLLKIGLIQYLQLSNEIGRSIARRLRAPLPHKLDTHGHDRENFLRRRFLD